MVVGLWPAVAVALSLSDNLHVHGFASQSLVHASGNKLGDGSNRGVSTEFRELGSGFTWLPAPEWTVSAQALSRWHGESDSGAMRLDYGFVDKRVISTQESALGVRVGKIKNPYGLYNESRDVPHARPGILMPQSVYMDRARSLWLSANGVALYGHRYSEDSLITAQLNVIKPESDSMDLSYLVVGEPGKLEGRASWLGQLTYSISPKARVGLSLAQLRFGFGPQPASRLLPGNTQLTAALLSAEIASANWAAVFEYGQAQVDSRNYGNSRQAMVIEMDNTVESGYAQLTRRLGPNWEAFLRYDVFFSDKNDRYGKRLQQLTGAPESALYYRFAKDATVGVRWTKGPWSWAGEWHNVTGTAWLSPLEIVGETPSRKWDVFLLQGAWRF